MTVTNLLDLNSIKEEQVIFLRNSDVIGTATRSVETVTETFDGDGSTTTFVLANSNVKNVRVVNNGTSNLTNYSEYVANYGTASVIFVTAPGTGTDNVSIRYDYGTDKIFADYPRVDLSITSYPRVSVIITSVRSDEVGIGAGANVNDVLFTVQVWDDNVNDIDDYAKTIKEKYLENKSGFNFLEFVTPVTMSSVTHEVDRADKIDSRALEFRGLFNFEFIS